MPARTSQLFLDGVFPVTMTHDEVVQKKLKPGKFIFNPTGIIKVLGLMFLLGGITFYVALHTDYSEGKVYTFLIPNLIVLLTSFTLYLIFSLGYARKEPWIYVKIDIAVNIILPIISIICTIVAGSPTTANNSVKDLPLPFGITGNVLLLVSAATLFMLYRYKDDNFQPKDPNPLDRRRNDLIDARPSIHI